MAPEALTGLIFYDPVELVVEHWPYGAEAGTVLYLDQDYTISGDWASGTASITPRAVYPLGAEWRIRREGLIRQPEVLPKISPLSSKDVERGLDRPILRLQEHAREIMRTWRSPRGENGLDLPGVGKRALKALFFDSEGNADPISIDDFSEPARAAADRAETIANGLQITTTFKDALFGSKIALAAVTTPTPGQSAVVTDPAKGGNFRFSSIDRSAEVALDPDGGLFFPPSGGNGSAGAWERSFGTTVMAEWFGCVGDGLTDDQPAFQRLVNTMAALYPKGFTVSAALNKLFRFGAVVRLPSGARIESINFTNAGTNNFFEVVGGLTAPTAFTEFVTDIAIAGCNFFCDVSNTSNVLRARNFKRLRLQNNIFQNCSLSSFGHAAEDLGLYKIANGSADSSGLPGSGTDPAIVAGFSTGPDFDDLNSDCTISGNVGNSGRYNGSLARLEFIKNVTITNNIGIGCKISWWGGGASAAEGGELWMKRRVRNVTITNNYLSRANGCINGNNSDGMTIADNICEDSMDTCLDLEGCFNCSVTGNFVRDAGNFCTSIFYASMNNVFANNTLLQTKRAKNLGSFLNTTGYTSAGTCTSSAGTNGRVRLTFAASHGFSDDQMIAPGTKSGNMGAALSGWYPILILDATTLELVGTEDIGTMTGAVSNVRYQRGNIMFQSNLATFDAADEADRVLWQGNTCIYEGTHNLATINGDTAMRTMMVSGNHLRNVRIVDVSLDSKSVIQGNYLEFDSQPVWATANVALLQSTGRIIDNTLKVLPKCVLPAGTVGIATYQVVSSGTWGEMRGNSVEDWPSQLTADMGYQYRVDASNPCGLMIIDNVFDTVLDMNASKGSIRIVYEGNRSKNKSLPVARPAVASIGTLGGLVRGTKIESGVALSAGGVFAQVALNDGWDTSNAWVAGMNVAVGDMLYSGSSVYRATAAGVAGATAPTGTGTAVSDGTLTYRYITAKVVWGALSLAAPSAVSSAATGAITPDISTAGTFVRTALSGGIAINAPTGTPFDGQPIRFRLKDNATARALAWNAIYRAIGVALPGTTTASKTTYVAGSYNAADARWDITSVQTEA
ncbi:hypothetical protein ADT71_23925 [Novosphingobium sp. ST904]|nr:hypothetical protein ADT71_23925 [Novosphingobium sp. ST904]TCM37719.1 hypothetical protein EDF59_110115 [Novosphingobium sp. ST904]